MVSESLITKDFFKLSEKIISLDSINPRLALISSAIPIIDINSRGGDVDAQGLPILYSCSYDTTVDGQVAETNNCTALASFILDSNSGYISWTPATLGSYEFKIKGKNANAEDQLVFTINVLASNSAPSLDLINSHYVGVGHTNSTIDAGDSADDLDSDGHVIYYECYYDTVIDANVMPSNKCESLSGLSFNKNTGILDWTPSKNQEMNYEFKIIGSDTLLSSQVIFNLYVVSPFVSRWRITTDGESVTLPLRSGYLYDFVVDWGDGFTSAPITAVGSADATHSYAQAGDYTITIIGKVESWYFGGAAVKTQIIAVNDLGNMKWKNLSGAFLGCSNLASFSGGNTSLVTDMSLMFLGATTITKIDLTSFDTSNVTNMNNMFCNTYALSSLNISSFNTSNVTTMSGMFYMSHTITSLDISSFNTSNVTDMSSMFDRASSLSTLNLSNFNTANVTNMTNMFYSASSLTSLTLSNFNTSGVTSMNEMFRGTTALTSLNLNGWDISLAPSATNIFLNMNGTLYCDQGGSPGTGSMFGKACN